jgi:predicted esterase
MQEYELTFKSLNSENYAKPITVLVMQPDKMDEHTGVMVFTHGWGGARFQHADKMAWTADRFNVVCLSAEYRMSGFDFNPVTGQGAYRPYDASFMQTFDVLNALRFVLGQYPSLNRRRIFHYGGSQGGHICLLSSIFAPNTFAFVYASCPLVRITPKKAAWSGREFAPYELSVRNVLEHSGLIRCPVYLEYGTADETVDCTEHSELLIQQLRRQNHALQVEVYEGGGHSLEPTITKLAAFQKMAPTPLQSLTSDTQDDFAAGSLVRIPCGEKTLHIDWSKPTADIHLVQWAAD